jgi:hypothetical protein
MQRETKRRGNPAFFMREGNSGGSDARGSQIANFCGQSGACYGQREKRPKIKNHHALKKASLPSRKIYTIRLTK